MKCTIIQRELEQEDTEKTLLIDIKEYEYASVR